MLVAFAARAAFCLAGGMSSRLARQGHPIGPKRATRRKPPLRAACATISDFCGANSAEQPCVKAKSHLFSGYSNNKMLQLESGPSGPLRTDFKLRDATAADDQHELSGQQRSGPTRGASCAKLALPLILPPWSNRCSKSLGFRLVRVKVQGGGAGPDRAADG